MNLEEAMADIDNRKLSNEKRMNLDIAKMQYNTQSYNQALQVIKCIMPNLVNTLHKQGLEIDSFAIVKTGHDNTWTEDSKLKLNLCLTRFNKKIRFIAHSGYDKHGRGLNHNRLVAKAEKLQKAINDGTGLMNVSVNPFSFQSDTDDMDKTILCDIWVC